MKRPFLIVLVLGFFTSAHPQSSGPLSQWKQWDRNGDGVLTLDEVPAPVKRLFDRIDANSDGELSEAELETVNRRLAQRDNPGRMAAPLVLPDGVTMRKDQVYREGHDRWKVDLYLPEGEAPEGGRPGIVFVHGGGWRSGSKDSGNWSSLPASYAAKGYVCISVNYRLVGDGGGFPACVHDVKNAVRWFRANADELGLDPERIGAYGNSAGAHLVSMLGLTKPEAGLEGDGTYLEESSLVQAVCASATPSDFLSWNGALFHNESLLAGDEATLEERAAAASPIRYAAADAPPFLLIHARDDTVVPYRQGKVLEETLKEAGAAEVELLSYDTGGHGVFGNLKSETHPAMAAFFAKSLKHGE